ncbi:hypothetical protein R0K17_00110 [Planococcus sp. SIMBA_143]
MKRKAKAALYTSLGLVLVPLLMYTISELEGIDAAAFFLASYILLIFLFGNFVFGIPVSLIADWATARAGKFCVLLVLIIHITFGFISYLFLHDCVIFAVISSIVFFVVDEILRKREKPEQQSSMSIVQI